jgi:hypothetical protein
MKISDLLLCTFVLFLGCVALASCQSAADDDSAGDDSTDDTQVLDDTSGTDDADDDSAAPQDDAGDDLADDDENDDAADDDITDDDLDDTSGDDSLNDDTFDDDASDDDTGSGDDTLADDTDGDDTAGDDTAGDDTDDDDTMAANPEKIRPGMFIELSLAVAPDGTLQALLTEMNEADCFWNDLYSAMKSPGGAWEFTPLGIGYSDCNFQYHEEHQYIIDYGESASMVLVPDSDPYLLYSYWHYTWIDPWPGPPISTYYAELRDSTGVIADSTDDCPDGGCGEFGMGNSTAVNPDGVPRASYVIAFGSDPAERSLFYYHEGVKDAVTTESFNGNRTSLGIDAQGKAFIAYCTVDGLRLAADASGIWAVSTVLGGVDCSGGTQLLIDTNDAVHLIASSGSDLLHIDNVEGTWNTETIAAGTGTAFGPQAILDENGHIYAAWLDRSGEHRHTYATNRTGAWETHPFGPVGMWEPSPAIALGPDGLIHILYGDYRGYPYHYADLYHLTFPADGAPPSQ